MTGGPVNYVEKLLGDDGGEDLIEYGLLAAFIAIAAVVTLRAIAPLVEAMWGIIRDAIAG
ncbi:MAG: Flp family type IVb pilin [Acidobacteria bacterium]|jgi:Flp pilus assembly pilin Flp|nr:MAG: Flp family type IVb pilin [Acidobacteriota bacterium]